MSTRWIGRPSPTRCPRAGEHGGGGRKGSRREREEKEVPSGKGGKGAKYFAGESLEGIPVRVFPKFYFHWGVVVDLPTLCTRGNALEDQFNMVPHTTIKSPEGNIRYKRCRISAHKTRSEF